MDILLDDGKGGNAAGRNVRLWLVCGAGVFAPWLWSAWTMPLWAAAVALVIAIAALLLLVRFVKQLGAERQARHTHAQQSGQSQAEQAYAAANAARDMLAAWLSASQTAGANLKQARAVLDEVTQQSETAAASVGKSFQAIMNKSGQQMDHALRLLKSNVEAGGGSTWLSLPDFIKAYENQLDTVTGRMMDFSKASEEMSRHQEVVREHSLAIDEMLDELRNMAARIRKLALDSTVAANREAGSDTRWFVEIADRIRETSTSAHELTRRMRDGLEKIREVMSGTYEELSKSSDNVRLAAVQAKVDVSQLNIATLEKAREVTVTLEKITALSREVRQDINQIIVAMQYQDITQQKLEQVKAPLLASAAASLAQHEAETRAAGITPAAAAAGEQAARVQDPNKSKTVDVELF